MISIVMPVYNAVDTLDDAFQSALRSGVPDQEIVLVDDGSTDGSWQAIQGYQAAHSNVVALRHDRNRGGGAARNTGVRAARHELVFVLDSDDVLIDNALQRVVAMPTLSTIDGLCMGSTLLFRDDPATIHRTVEYRPGKARFQDLVSHKPNPVTGNLLFRRTIFDRVGGYPEHHGFDTQGFGFRIMANNANIVVHDSALYYQRTPSRPSYYIREARAGNIGRNWFYILSEVLYKFDPPTRRTITQFPVDDPAIGASNQNLFDTISAMAEKQDIFSADGLTHDECSAYEAYKDASDETLQAWCAGVDLRRNDLRRFLERLDALGRGDAARRTIYPLLASWSKNRLSAEEIDELRYFFGEKKGKIWGARHFLSRIIRKLAV